MTPWTRRPQLLRARLVTPAGQTFNGLAVTQGHLVLLARGGQTELRAWFDERGHLLVQAPDAARYSLRPADGHLVYDADNSATPASDFLPEDFTTQVDFR